MSAAALALLKDMIRCPSVTPEEAGVLELVERFLAPLGFECRRLRFEGDGSYPVDNLFAIRKGGARRLLFAGHTDVVPPGDAASWRHPPFAAEEDQGHIYGRGACDMKSGVAAFCGALADLAAWGDLDAGTIALAITNDEEADAINGTAKLMEWATREGHRFDFAIVGEPSSAEILGDSIKLGRRGSFSGRVVVTGRQGHVAYPDRARNPLPVLARLVLALDAPFDGGSDHFQPSNLEVTSIDTGNPAGNVVPQRSEFRFNIRFNDHWDADRLAAEIGRRIAATETAGCEVDFSVTGTIANTFLSPADGTTALLGDTIEHLLGHRPLLSTGGGTSDARFIAQYCPVVECGLVGTTMHQTDERVAISDVEGLTEIYAAFMRRFFAEGAP